MNPLDIDMYAYQNAKPFPHASMKNVVDETFALKIQNEILDISDSEWDRYNNPLEQKYTLRDKNKIPTNTQKLFDILTSDSFVNELSTIVGYQLINDPNKNWWGVHKYDNGDFLEIHSDAGIHPITGQKKHVTLGIYLSKNWTEENKGHLEIWDGDSVINDDAKLYQRFTKIIPYFNTLVLFDNTNNAWHGNPEPVNCGENSKRIFLTLSYLSEHHEKPYDNIRKKAFFVKCPDDPEDEEKDKIRLLRADEHKYKEIYGCGKK